MNSNGKYSGVKVLILGLGLNGGGVETALYLGRRGAELCITDTSDEKTLALSIEKLKAGLGDNEKNIRYVLGRHEITDFENADIVIKNPGVRPDMPLLKAARHIETDISLFLESSTARLSAVTGTKGKSSIASAIHCVLKEWHANRQSTAHLGGNITISPLSFPDDLNEGDDVVLELSSFQLGDLKGRLNKKTGLGLLKPRAAVISSIMPDHLDRYYGVMDAYIADKRVIYQSQDESDILVIENDDWGMSFQNESKGRHLVYSTAPLAPNIAGGWIDAEQGSGFARISGDIVEVVPPELHVAGKHQKKNLLAAALALLDLGLEPGFIRENLGKFKGVEHRLEFFHESNGIKFYNDSAATIPEAAAAAVNAFDIPVILVCGGNDKNLDFAPLVEAAPKAAALILLEGTGSVRLTVSLDKAGIAYNGPFNTLDNVLSAVMRYTKPGSIVVLSPGCTGFGLFDNEFDRGRKWKEAVKKTF